MSESSGSLVCLECGQPIPDGERWVHFPQCAAVMALVRHGRSNLEKDPDPDDPDVLNADPDRLNRYRREAGIVGHFPPLPVRQAVRRRDRGYCQYPEPSCTEGGAMRIDWKEDDPSLKSPRADDLRTLCDHHHREVSLRRFVGERGQVARTGPAMWARMVAAKPLVLRDDSSLWKEPKNRAFLRHWPLASEQTRRDWDNWVEAFAAVSSEAGGGAGDHPLGQLDLVSAAFEELHLPQRNMDNLVRAIHAVLLSWQADEATNEAIREKLAPWRDRPPAPEERQRD